MKKIYRFSSIDSTNAEAIRWARKGGEEAIFVAEQQTAGRGREGRQWESPPGNLYVSFLLRPPLPPVDLVPMTQLVAVVVKALLEDLIPHPPLLDQGEGGRGGEVVIKPPNDILWNGRKVCGILCEMSSQGEKTGWVVVGIGLNVNAGPEDFSSEVRETATSLKTALGREFDREKILGDLVIAMERWYENFRR